MVQTFTIHSKTPINCFKKDHKKVGEGRGEYKCRKITTYKRFKGVKFTGTTINKGYAGKWCVEI